MENGDSGRKMKGKNINGNSKVRKNEKKINNGGK